MTLERLVGDEREKPPLQHVAIIMDGNRRWAQLHEKPVVDGHKEGKQRIEPIIRRCSLLGIEVVTFYALSTENFGRSEEDIRGLLDLLKKGIPEATQRLLNEGVRFRAIGDMEFFPSDIQIYMRSAEQKSQEKEGITVNLALGYGGRNEITRAFRKIVSMGVTTNQITEELISDHLDTAMQPDPDLIIRTGGRHRLSGFLPWQGTYSEIYFTDTLWPDFTIHDFNKAISWYEQQIRTSGK